MIVPIAISFFKGFQMNYGVFCKDEKQSLILFDCDSAQICIKQLALISLYK
jgi:hypothetical protein